MLTVSIFYDNPLFTQMDGPFTRLCKDNWFDDKRVCEWIADIDKMTHLQGSVFKDRWGSIVSPMVLSSGSKALCLMKYQDDYPVFATRCGDNCVKYIEMLSTEKDLNIVLQHCMPFSDGFEFYVTDVGRNVTGGMDWEDVFYAVRREVCEAKLNNSN